MPFPDIHRLNSFPTEVLTPCKKKQLLSAGCVFVCLLTVLTLTKPIDLIYSEKSWKNITWDNSLIPSWLLLYNQNNKYVIEIKQNQSVSK